MHISETYTKYSAQMDWWKWISVFFDWFSESPVVFPDSKLITTCKLDKFSEFVLCEWFTWTHPRMSLQRVYTTIISRLIQHFHKISMRKRFTLLCKFLTNFSLMETERCVGVCGCPTYIFIFPLNHTYVWKLKVTKKNADSHKIIITLPQVAFRGFGWCKLSRWELEICGSRRHKIIPTA